MAQGADVPAADALLADDACRWSGPRRRGRRGWRSRGCRPRPPRRPTRSCPAASPVGGVVLVDLEAGAVVAVQPVLGGQPDVAPPILQDVHHRGLREPLLEREAVEADRTGRGGHHLRGQGQDGEGECGQAANRHGAQFHVSALHGRHDARMGPMPRRSSSANMSAGTAGEKRNPWYSLHPWR